MVQNALESRPPLGKIRDFSTEDAPGAPHTVNLKLHGVRPFVDAARIYALAHALPQTNTAERLRAARERTGMSASETEAIVQAFFYVQQVRLRNQAAIGKLTEENANRIDPDRLNELEKQVLKQAFLQARKLQSRLALDYQV
jgi:CBS domain-containing protein